ncbi:MAG: hypothetical protein ACRDNP_16440, partial [Gaiellaceae bacterium]
MLVAAIRATRSSRGVSGMAVWTTACSVFVTVGGFVATPYPTPPAATAAAVTAAAFAANPAAIPV